jgi:hypothetical protein
LVLLAKAELKKALAMSDDDCKIFSASQQSPGDELLDLD